MAKSEKKTRERKVPSLALSLVPLIGLIFFLGVGYGKFRFPTQVCMLCAAAVAAVGMAKPSLLESAVPTLMKTLSPFERFYTFVNGVFDVTGIVYYISVTVFFLFLCVQCWEKKRYNG